MPDFTISPKQLLARIPAKNRFQARILVSIHTGNNQSLVQVLDTPPWLSLESTGLNQNPSGYQKYLNLQFDSSRGVLGPNRAIFTLLFLANGVVYRERIPAEMVVVESDFVAEEPYRVSQASAVLSYMYDLILQGWTQGAPSRDLAGERVENPRDTVALEWCLSGALEKAKDYHTQHGKFPLLNAKAMEVAFGLEIDGQSLDKWNDAPGRDQFQVLALIQRVQTKLSGVLRRLAFQKAAQIRPGENTLQTIVWPPPPPPPPSSSGE